MKKSTILRGMFICMFLMLSMLVYEVSNSYSLYQKAIKTNSTPITNKVVVLDARASVFLMRARWVLQELQSKP